VQKFLRQNDDKFNVDAAKIDQGQQKIDLDTQKMMNDMNIKLAELEQKMMAQSVKEVTVITE
jgi:hypothetical protein